MRGEPLFSAEHAVAIHDQAGKVVLHVLRRAARAVCDPGDEKPRHARVSSRRRRRGKRRRSKKAAPPALDRPILNPTATVVVVEVRGARSSDDAHASCCASPRARRALAFGDAPADFRGRQRAVRRRHLRSAPWRADADGRHAAPPSIQLTRHLEGRTLSIGDTSTKARGRVAEGSKRLFTVEHALPPETPLYGEGFQMLAARPAAPLGGIRSILATTPTSSITGCRSPRAFAWSTTLFSLDRPRDAATRCWHSRRARFSGQFRLRQGALTSCWILEGTRAQSRRSAGRLKSSRFLGGTDREALLASVARPPRSASSYRWPLRRRRQAGARGIASVRGLRRSRCSTTST